MPTVLNHDEVYFDEEKIVASGKPIIGICLGCEIICKVFGGELEQMPAPASGEREFTVYDPSLQERLQGNKLKAYEHHGICIVKMPREFSVVAMSEHGPEIIKHIQKPIIGVQFHPEVGTMEVLWQWLKDVEGLQ